MSEEQTKGIRKGRRTGGTGNPEFRHYNNMITITITARLHDSVTMLQNGRDIPRIYFTEEAEIFARIFVPLAREMTGSNHKGAVSGMCRE